MIQNAEKQYTHTELKEKIKDLGLTLLFVSKQLGYSDAHFRRVLLGQKTMYPVFHDKVVAFLNRYKNV